MTYPQYTTTPLEERHPLTFSPSSSPSNTPYWLLTPLTGQIKRSSDECDATKKLLLASDSQIRQLEEAVTWGKKSVEESVTIRSGLEKTMAEKVLAAKKDREEVDALRKELQDAESQRRRDGDEVVRLTHLLTDATAAKASGDKTIADLEVQTKRLREDAERGRRYTHPLNGHA